MDEAGNVLLCLFLGDVSRRGRMKETLRHSESAPILSRLMIWLEIRMRMEMLSRRDGFELNALLEIHGRKD
uniref:Uncharacterized protein n=1 Tax=Utricularia reniformis TaxID=192314 RepID=A0A1Y0AZB0_9LAMI|nr:hypothetical protein AEK19_MT0186 [Utricularia reniformis]ART30468.1 hypothetical protein AEK19_MT0186 [Utricularia reniformis]